MPCSAEATSDDPVCRHISWKAESKASASRVFSPLLPPANGFITQVIRLCGLHGPMPLFQVAATLFPYTSTKPQGPGAGLAGTRHIQERPACAGKRDEHEEPQERARSAGMRQVS